MIAKEILKKFNLKAVPFSCIRDRETFYIEYSISANGPNTAFQRLLDQGVVYVWGPFTNKWTMSGCTTQKLKHRAVYVPVWRPTTQV
jgi:hypothetical protein